MKRSYLGILLLPLLLTMCTTVPQKPVQFVPRSWEDVPAWKTDALEEAWPAMIQSCRAEGWKSSLSNPLLTSENVARMKTVCQKVKAMPAAPSQLQVRQFLQENFDVYQVTQAGESTGLLTGYFEPLLRGSRTPSEVYSVPLFGRPKDLILIPDLGAFAKDLAGRRLAGRVKDGQLVPYDDREAIYQKHPDSPVIVWVDDMLDAFFLEIQGSGRVKLDTGETICVGYAASNGRPYTAIGKTLKEEGRLAGAEISMRGIKKWLRENPAQMHRILIENKSYVFFREVTGPGPLGSQGVPLTPERSMAIDPMVVPLGTPLFIASDKTPYYNRLMVAQDTGGAIKGSIRGDFFWGHGPRAEEGASGLKEPISFSLLLPKGVTLPEAYGRQ